MNQSSSHTQTDLLFSHLQALPADPVLGMTDNWRRDTNPRKVNLGVGIYQNAEGKVPVLNSFRQAEEKFFKANAPFPYLTIDGLADYHRGVQELIFGIDCPALKEGRITTIQTLGGTGGLRIGSDLLLYTLGTLPQIWVSDPTWENHTSLLERAGFKVKVYPYYDPQTRGLNFSGMRSAIQLMPAKSVILLHVCCHNPTGADLNSNEWQEVFELLKQRQIIPFLDFAYQGLSQDVEQDAWPVRQLIKSGVSFLVSSSFSKNFSLYGERLGALSIVTQSAEQAEIVRSIVKRLIRGNYSSPPTYGGKIVSTVLNDAQLKTLWLTEVKSMRDRIKEMRHALVSGLSARNSNLDFSFIERQVGMFSYSGLSLESVRQLRSRYGIYALDTGRICVAALNPQNIDYVCDAIAEVLAESSMLQAPVVPDSRPA